MVKLSSPENIRIIMKNVRTAGVSINMRVFVTGVGGQLGHDVMNELARRGYEGVEATLLLPTTESLMALQLPQCLMCRWISLTRLLWKVIKEANVDAVIHCAAWTAVDAAEDEENQLKVRLVNVNRNPEYCWCAKSLTSDVSVHWLCIRWPGIHSMNLTARTINH